MQLQGQIKKMQTEKASPIAYYLNLSEDLLLVNGLIGKTIEVIHHHNQCLNCQKDKEIYRMGYCKTCFFEVPQTNESIIRPELSTAHLGIEKRDLAFEQALELQPHIVYLAVSSGLKVGVTRKTQIPTRWIDQGATKALVIAETQNRYQAGITEVALAKHVSDKTNYRKMLTSENDAIDLIQWREKMVEFFPEETKPFFVPDSEIVSLEFPIPVYPEKIKSINLAKEKRFKKKLVGIKGQYLIFEDHSVWNVRSHEGYYVHINV